MKKPNIVLILTDTQPKRLTGAYSDDWTSTPCLDRFAQQGMTFDRAYTPCPLCTPARGALFTGLMPVTNGAYANEMTPQDKLRANGYDYAVVGLSCWLQW